MEEHHWPQKEGVFRQAKDAGLGKNLDRFSEPLAAMSR
jgi:hypothetical protein